MGYYTWSVVCCSTSGPILASALRYLAIISITMTSTIFPAQELSINGLSYNRNYNATVNAINCIGEYNSTSIAISKGIMLLALNYIVLYFQHSFP